MEDPKGRSQYLRRVAFAAVALSTVAVAACLVAFPMVFNLVMTLRAEVDTEMTFCKVSTCHKQPPLLTTSDVPWFKPRPLPRFASTANGCTNFQEILPK